VFILGAVITALLSLDVTVIMLSPIVYAIAVRRRLDALPFMFVCTFVANTASLVFPVSNLTNLLVYHDLKLSFSEFASAMWLPNLAAAVANLAVFLFLFRSRIPARFDRGSELPLPPIDRWFAIAALVLAASLAGLLTLGLLEHPLAPAALAGAALLFVCGLQMKRTTVQALRREISWSVFVFVIGMFVVVRGVERGLLDDLHVSVSSDPVRAMLWGSIAAAVGSNVVNNVPMTLLMMSVFPRVDGPAREALAYGTLLGANIGPTLTTYGSLATILWLNVLRKRGIEVSVRDYLAIGVVTMPVVLAAATVTLWLTL
jgi:arsenical pump membrane protein